MDNITPTNSPQPNNAGVPSGGFIPTSAAPAAPIPTPPQPIMQPAPAAAQPVATPIIQPVTTTGNEINPLRQFFRRPAVHIRLPSGGEGYPAGAIDMPPTGELQLMKLLPELQTHCSMVLL